METTTANPLGLFFLVLMLLGCGLVSFLEISMEDLVMTDPAHRYGTRPTNADVTYVRAVQTGPDTWTFHAAGRTS